MRSPDVQPLPGAIKPVAWDRLVVHCLRVPLERRAKRVWMRWGVASGALQTEAQSWPAPLARGEAGPQSPLRVAT
jgi:hypothetical protein